MSGSEYKLLGDVDKGISEAYSYSPTSHGADESKGVFERCKTAMDALAIMESEKGFEKMAFIYTECMRDGFIHSGLRDHARRILNNSGSLLSRFYTGIFEGDVDTLCFLTSQSQILRTKLENIASRANSLDPFEAPTNLIESCKTANRTLRVLDNLQELEEVLKKREVRLEQQKQSEEEARRISAEKRAERRRIDIQSKRRALGVCIMCGQELGFWGRLFSDDRHKKCRNYQE
jgi:hypothetical protein